MKKYFLRVVVASGLLLSSFVHAANEELPWPPGNEERNQSFSISIGNSDIKDDGFHDQGAVFRLHGGTRFGDFVALEAGMIYYGETKDLYFDNDLGNFVDLEIEGHAIEVQLLGIAPLLTWLELFGKVGVSKWKLKYNWDEFIGPGVVLVGKATEKGEDPIYGAGFLFNVDHDSTLRLEYEQYELDDADYKVISFAVMHRF